MAPGKSSRWRRCCEASAYFAPQVGGLATLYFAPLALSLAFLSCEVSCIGSGCFGVPGGSAEAIALLADRSGYSAVAVDLYWLCAVALLATAVVGMVMRTRKENQARMDPWAATWAARAHEGAIRLARYAAYSSAPFVILFVFSLAADIRAKQRVEAVAGFLETTDRPHVDCVVNGMMLLTGDAAIGERSVPASVQLPADKAERVVKLLNRDVGRAIFSGDGFPRIGRTR